MKRVSNLLRLPALILTIFFFALPAQAYFEFNQQGDNETFDLGYYVTVTGGKFPTGNIPSGDDTTGGTFRFLLDDPAWGYPIDIWNKSDWFPEGAGLALTLKNGNVVVYDNNGIEDGSGAGFYNYTGAICDGYWPGAYRLYCMANNWDWIYATYFKLGQQTTFDTIIGYFGRAFSDVTDFDPHSPSVGYRMNIWSSTQDDPRINPNSYMPAVASFTGDVFSTNSMLGRVSQVSETGMNIVFPDCPELSNLPTTPEPIWRLELKLRQPVTLPAGIYFFSHDAIVVTPIVIDIKPGSSSNVIDLKSEGTIPVAILSTSTFKASRIDTSTVALAGASPVSWTMKDVDHDGDIDKLLYFNARDLMLDENSTEATLTGYTKEEIPIKGVDTVKIAPQKQLRF